MSVCWFGLEGYEAEECKEECEEPPVQLSSSRQSAVGPPSPRSSRALGPIWLGYKVLNFPQTHFEKFLLSSKSFKFTFLQKFFYILEKEKPSFSKFRSQVLPVSPPMSQVSGGGMNEIFDDTVVPCFIFSCEYKYIVWSDQTSWCFTHHHITSRYILLSLDTHILCKLARSFAFDVTLASYLAICL